MNHSFAHWSLVLKHTVYQRLYVFSRRLDPMFFEISYKKADVILFILVQHFVSIK